MLVVGLVVQHMVQGEQLLHRVRRAGVRGLMAEQEQQQGSRWCGQQLLGADSWQQEVMRFGGGV